MISIHYQSSATVFRSRRTFANRALANPQAQPTVYYMTRPPAEADLVCDRCSKEEVTIKGVIVDRAAEIVRVYCGPC